MQAALGYTGASKNAGFLLPDQKRITPGWAVGWFFIPFANLFKPYQAMRETYNSSVSPPQALDAGMPGLFKWWWAVFLINNFAANISLQMARGEGLDSMKSSTLVDLVNAPVSVAAILLWLKIVDTVTDEQKNNVDVFA